MSHDQVIQWTKAKVLVYSDSVSCLVKMNDSKDAIIKWEGQVGEFKMSLSYKELLGIDGELIEFEWNMFPGFSSLQMLQEIWNDLRKLNIELEIFTDRTIFMSMSNDIDWTSKGIDEDLYFRIQKKSRHTRRDSRKHSGRSCRGDEKKPRDGPRVRHEGRSFS